MKIDGLDEYVVSYWEDGENLVFTCHADDEEHAREQCQDAYPNVFISDCWIASED